MLSVAAGGLDELFHGDDRTIFALECLKALALRPWAKGETHTWSKCWYKPIDDAAAATTALRFTLSKPVTAAVSPGHAELLWLACDTADAFVPMSEGDEGQVAQVQDSRPIFQEER